MNLRKKSLRIAAVVLCCIVGSAILAALILWTSSIKSHQRERELRTAMQEVLGVSGEKGLLEMAGVPVDNIFYGERGVTLFQGDSASWTYSADELQNISVYAVVQSSVVHISTVVESNVSSFLDVMPENGVGSGFFISDEGYILTNKHVVSGASEIKVTLSDGSVHNAQLTGTDDENDIAVIKIEADGLVCRPLEFGDSDSLVVGQKVLAIGNPFGYDRTMVTGIVSGLSRPIRNEQGQVLLGMIQTDAPINPGNSGGPLLDARGRVIGISTSIYSSAGTGMGMNFAVASNTASASSQDLIRFGKVNRGWLDIVPVQLSRQIVEYAGLKVNRGILVSQVVPHGEAEEAGIRGGTNQVRYGDSLIFLGGDVITSVNGTKTEEYSDLFTALSNTRPGEKVNVEINRNGTVKTVNVKLVERNSENVGWINR
ncbi:MAG: trypsin-like peptidase domain-containing protein [Sphaerochaetaceae bacterium]|nr:trypsin-like peptidase domain-containing protein [Sphaerochaetaceae bacterium]